MNISQETLNEATMEELIFAAKKIVEALEDKQLTQVQFKMAEAARSSIIALEYLIVG